MLPRASHVCPIAHLVPRTPCAVIRGDSSLLTAGSYSADLGFWWYLEWPQAVRDRTIRHVTNNKTNRFISINTLEYAAILINYLAAFY